MLLLFFLIIIIPQSLCLYWYCHVSESSVHWLFSLLLIVQYVGLIIFTYKTTVKVYKMENSYHHLLGNRLCYEHLEIVYSKVTIILKLFIPKLRSTWNCLFQSYDHLELEIVYSKVTIILKLFIPKLRSSWNCLFQSYDHLEIVYSKVTINLSMSYDHRDLSS